MFDITELQGICTAVQTRQMLSLATIDVLSSTLSDSTETLETRKTCLKVIAASVRNGQPISDVIVNAFTRVLIDLNEEESLRKVAAYVCMICLAEVSGKLRVQSSCLEKLKASLARALQDPNLKIRTYSACAMGYLSGDGSVDDTVDMAKKNPLTEMLIFYLEDAVKDAAIAKYATLSLHQLLKTNRYGLADDVFTALSNLLADNYALDLRVRVLEVMTHAIRNTQAVFSKTVLDAIERVFLEKNSALTTACLNAMLPHVQHLSEFKTLPPKLMKLVVSALNNPDTSNTALELLKMVARGANETEMQRVQKIIDNHEADLFVLPSQEPLSAPSIDVDENDDCFDFFDHQMNETQLPEAATSAASELNDKSLEQLCAELSVTNQNNPAILQLLHDSALQRQITAVLTISQQDSSLIETGKSIQEWEEADCTRWADALKTQPEKSRDPAFIAEMIAVVSQGNKLTNKNQPRQAQLLALISLLNTTINKGRLAQIATGEGKSTLVAMLAAIKVLQGETVDVVTSSPILASRDAEERKAFFKLFHMSVADNSEQNYIEGPKSCYKADVVYGDASHFQWDLLRTEYELKNTRNRPYGTVIVDEVDSMLIDDGGKNALLASQQPAMDHLIPLLSAAWTKLALLNSTKHFQEKNGRLYFQLDELSEPVEIADQSKCLTDILTAYITALINEKDVDGNDAPIHIPVHLKPFALSQAKQWAQSAVMAKLQLQFEKDYVTPTDENGHTIIAPVDYQNTGVTLNKSSWNNGLHQFLQLKHELEVTSETLSSSYISNMGYFKRYEKIYGLTGTFGDEDSQALLKTYPIDLVFIPTYKTKQLIEIPPLLKETPELWTESIISSVQAIAKKRAVLVVCESIHAAEDFETRLKNTRVKRVIPYYRSDNPEKMAVLEELQAGDVIVATALAGRGTDIKTSVEVEQNGGLHVCLTYLPNQRGQEQVFGRTARRGRPGSAQMIVNKVAAELKLKHRYFMLGNADSIDNLIEWRNNVESDRLEAIKSFEIEKINMQDALFTQFCQLRKQLHDRENDPDLLADMDERWSIWLNTLDNQIMEARTFDHEHVLAAFEQFKQQAIEDFTTHQIRNPSHWVKKGNRYNLRTKEERQKAIAAYTHAAQLDPNFAVQALYNRAEVIIHDQKAGYKAIATQDLREARSLIQEKLIPLLKTTPVIEGLARETNASAHHARSNQIQNKLDLLNQEVQSIDAAIDRIENIPGDVRVSQTRDLSHFFDDDKIPLSEINELREMGLQHLFEVEAIPEEDDDDDDDDDWFGMLCVAALGIMQVVVGVCLCLNAHYYLGTVIFLEGLGDIFTAVNSAMTQHFRWDEYKNSKITSISITAFTTLMWGVASIKAILSPSVAREASKQLGKEALKRETQKIVSKGIIQHAVKEISNIALNAVSREVMTQCKVNVEKHIRDEVFKELDDPEFNAVIDKFLSIDAHYKNQALQEPLPYQTFEQKLTQLASDIIYPKRNKIAGITSAIMKGVASNQHPVVGVFINFADIAVDTIELSDLCHQFCQELKARVRFMDHKLTTIHPKQVDLTPDRATKREKLYETFVSMLSQCFKKRLHSNLIRPTAGTIMERVTHAVVNATKKRDFLTEMATQKKSEEALQNFHIPQTLHPLFNQKPNSPLPLQAPYLNSVLSLRDPKEIEMMKAIERTMAKHYQKISAQRPFKRNFLTDVKNKQKTDEALQNILIPQTLRPLFNQKTNSQSPPKALYLNSVLALSDPKEIEMMKAIEWTMVKHYQQKATVKDVGIALLLWGEDVVKLAVSPLVLLWDVAILTGTQPNSHFFDYSEQATWQTQLSQTSTYQNAMQRMTERIEASQSTVVFLWDNTLLSVPYQHEMLLTTEERVISQNEMRQFSFYEEAFQRDTKRNNAAAQRIQGFMELSESEQVQALTRLAAHGLLTPIVGNKIGSYINSRGRSTHPREKNHVYDYTKEYGPIFDAVYVDGRWILERNHAQLTSSSTKSSLLQQITYRDLKPTHFKKPPFIPPNLPTIIAGAISIIGHQASPSFVITPTEAVQLLFRTHQPNIESNALGEFWSFLYERSQKSIETVNRTFYKGAVLQKPNIQDTLYHPSSSQDLFTETPLRVIHLGQAHAAPITLFHTADMKEHVVRSQLIVAEKITKYFEKDPTTIILDEGCTIDRACPNTLLGKMMTYKIRKSFPSGIPEQYASLTPKQIDLLYWQGAPKIMLALSQIPRLYKCESLADHLNPAITIKIGIQLLRFMTSLRKIKAIPDLMERRNAVEAFLKDNSICNKSNKLIFERRERYALDCAISAAKKLKTKKTVTVVLVFGAAHDFNKYAIYNIPIETIDTTLIAELRRNEDLDHIYKTSAMTESIIHKHTSVGPRYERAQKSHVVASEQLSFQNPQTTDHSFYFPAGWMKCVMSQPFLRSDLFSQLPKNIQAYIATNHTLPGFKSLASKQAIFNSDSVSAASRHPSKQESKKQTTVAQEIFSIPAIASQHAMIERHINQTIKTLVPTYESGDGQIMFRGEKPHKLGPEDRFNNGIRPPGSHRDVEKHAQGATDSNLVSLTTDWMVARSFSWDGPNKRGYVYVVVHPEKSISTEATFNIEHGYKPSDEAEWLAPNGISPENIIGVFEVSGNEFTTFTPNPNYSFVDKQRCWDEYCEWKSSFSEACHDFIYSTPEAWVYSQERKNFFSNRICFSEYLEWERTYLKDHSYTQDNDIFVYTTPEAWLASEERENLLAKKGRLRAHDPRHQDNTIKSALHRAYYYEHGADLDIHINDEYHLSISYSDLEQFDDHECDSPEFIAFIKNNMGNYSLPSPASGRREQVVTNTALDSEKIDICYEGISIISIEMLPYKPRRSYSTQDLPPTVVQHALEQERQHLQQLIRSIRPIKEEDLSEEDLADEVSTSHASGRLSKLLDKVPSYQIKSRITLFSLPDGLRIVSKNIPSIWNEVLKEIKALDVFSALQLQHVRLPKILGVELGRPNNTLYLTYLPGMNVNWYIEQLAHIDGNSRSSILTDAQNALKAVGMALAEVHAHGVKPFPPHEIENYSNKLRHLQKYFEKKLGAHFPVTPVEVEEIIRDFKKNPGQYSLIHGDANLDNFLYDCSGELSMFGMGTMSTYGSSLKEFFETLGHLGYGTAFIPELQSLQENLVQGYMSTRHLTPENYYFFSLLEACDRLDTNYPLRGSTLPTNEYEDLARILVWISKIKINASLINQIHAPLDPIKLEEAWLREKEQIQRLAHQIRCLHEESSHISQSSQRIADDTATEKYVSTNEGVIDREMNFEIGTGSPHEKLQYPILEERFGQVLPHTFQYVKKTWSEGNNQGYAHFRTIQTNTNVLIVFLDYVGAFPGTTPGASTKTSGTLFHFMSHFQQLATQAGATRLYLQVHPSNERLGKLLCQRYRELEPRPMLTIGTTPEVVEMDMFAVDYKKMNFLTLEIPLSPKPGIDLENTPKNMTPSQPKNHSAGSNSFFSERLSSSHPAAEKQPKPM